MERYYNVHEALHILRKHYVTNSLQMVTRYIREGKLEAERTENRKVGFKIKESDLYDFIDRHHEGIVPLMAFYDDAIDRLDVEYPRKKVPENVVKEETVDDTKDKADEPVATGAINEEIKELIIKGNSRLEDKLEQLIDILKINYGQPATPTVENDRKEEKGTIKRRGEQHKKKSKGQFIKHIKKVTTEEERNDENLMNEVYAIYFDENEKMHKIVYPEPEMFVCPKTKHKVTEGNFIELLEKAVPEIIKEIKEKQQKDDETPSNANSQLSLFTEKI